MASSKQYINCNSDFDCPDKLVCYKNVSWAEDEIFCACDSWFGWQGRDCSSFGPQTIFFIIVHSCIFAFCLILLSVVGYKTYKYVQNRSKKIKFNPMIETLVSTVLYFFSRTLASVALIINVTDVSGFGDEQEVLNDGRKRGSQSVFYFVAINMMFFFGIHTCLTVGLVWLHIGYHTSRLQTSISSFMYKVRKVLRGLQIGFTLAVFTTLVVQYEFAVFVSSIFFAIIFIVFIVTRSTFKNILKGNYAQSSVPDALINIRRALRFIVGFFTLQLLLLLASQIIANVSSSFKDPEARDANPLDQVSPFIVTLTGAEICFTGVILTITWYLFTVMNVPSTSNKSSNSSAVKNHQPSATDTAGPHHSI